MDRARRAEAHARADWSEHALELAAKLANMMADAEAERRLLEKEGTVLTNSRGNRQANPRGHVLNQLNAAIIVFRRSLGLHYRAKVGGGDSETAAQRRQIAREIEAEYRPKRSPLQSRPGVAWVRENPDGSITEKRKDGRCFILYPDDSYIDGDELIRISGSPPD